MLLSLLCVAIEILSGWGHAEHDAKHLGVWTVASEEGEASEASEAGEAGEEVEEQRSRGAEEQRASVGVSGSE